MEKSYQKFYYLIFILAFALRLGVALLNTQANDDHLSVIRIIARENRIPDDKEAWEAFQPKLYHVSVAVLIKALTPVFNGTYHVKIAQLLNLLAGMWTVYTLYRFLALLPFTERTKFWSFTLAALNPQFIGINSQATNDSFIILFFTLSLYHAVLFLRHLQPKNLAALTIFSILAGLSKGNAILIVPIFLGVWIIELGWRKWVSRERAPRLLLVAPLIFLAGFLAIVPYFGQYLEKYQRYGTPFATNMDTQPMPQLFEETYVARPGVTSIADSYFTFRYIDLLLLPINTTTSAKNYELQRTSLWTQLYARAFFVHYDQYPRIWATRARFILYVGRFLYILALLPTALGILGLLKNLWSLLKPASTQQPVAYRERWLYLLGVGGFLAFIILYTLQIRDFSTMKAVFLYPALLCFVYVFGDGLEALTRKVNLTLVTRLLEGAFALMTILSCIDILYLIAQLAGML